MKKSTDYHDYVIKNGRLIGEFEEMYKNSDTIPWHQNEQKEWVDVLLTNSMLHGKTYDEIHDFGCGIGYYLDILNKMLGNKDTKCYGYDISQTACHKAKDIFKSNTFHQLDLMLDYNGFNKSNGNAGGGVAKSKLFALRGTLWYVFPKIANVVQNIASFMKPSDELLIVQNFPPLENNFVGKDILPNHIAIEKQFSKYFKPIQKIWYQNNELTKNDNWYIGIFKKITEE